MDTRDMRASRHLHVFVNTVLARTVIDIYVNDYYDANIVICVKNDGETTFRLLNAPARRAAFLLRTRFMSSSALLARGSSRCVRRG